MFHTCVVCLWGLPLCLSLTRHQNKPFTELSLTRLNRAHLGCDDTSGAPPPPQPPPDSPCLAQPAITVQELTDACQVGHGTTQTHRHTHKHSAVLVLANGRLCVTCASTVIFFILFYFFAFCVIGLEVCFFIVQTKMYIDFEIKEKLGLMGLLTDNNSNNTLDRIND